MTERIRISRHFDKHEHRFIGHICIRKGCNGTYHIIYNDVNCYLCGHGPYKKKYNVAIEPTTKNKIDKISVPTKKSKRPV